MTLKLKPSLRINRRYLEIIGKKEDIENAILDYIGMLGYAKSSPVFLKSKTNNLILSVDRKMLKDVRASFELCKNKIKIIRVSGTLKKLEMI